MFILSKVSISDDHPMLYALSLSLLFTCSMTISSFVFIVVHVVPPFL